MILFSESYHPDQSLLVSSLEKTASPSIFGADGMGKKFLHFFLSHRSLAELEKKFQ